MSDAPRDADDGYFGEAIAADYDDPADEMNSAEAVDPVVDVLARLAGGGRALELAIGTGRIAVPLAARGVPVVGIDMSRAMVRRLRAKPGGAEIAVAIGDLTTTVVEGGFSVVYLVYNTIMNLTAQASQVACFRNAAAHLDPGGSFLVEVMVPDLQRLPPGETVHPFQVGHDRWGFDEYDLARQGLISHHLSIRGGQARQVSIPFRYVWPSELDLMAQLAGLQLRERWGGWHGEPFTGQSRQHVSIWEKPLAAAGRSAPGARPDQNRGA